MKCKNTMTDIKNVLDKVEKLAEAVYEQQISIVSETEIPSVEETLLFLDYYMSEDAKITNKKVMSYVGDLVKSFNRDISTKATVLLKSYCGEKGIEILQDIYTSEYLVFGIDIVGIAVKEHESHKKTEAA